MMRILLALVAMSGVAMAFQVAPINRPTTSLQMGLLDDMFQPKKKKQSVVETTTTTSSSSVVQKKKKGKKSDDWIHSMFKDAFHGHGSAENDLDAMYEEQQKMLQERRHLFGNRDGMRAKYSDPTVDHLRDIPLHEHDPATLNQKEDDAMYIDEDDTGFSFPWDSKLKP